MIPKVLFLYIVTAVVAMNAVIADPAPASGAGKTYALLISGLGGEGPYQHWYEDWTSRFQRYLTGEAKVPAKNITTLTGAGATAAAITDALGKFAQSVKPEDQFILFIAGHGEVGGKSPTLILPGPDLDADTLSAALDRIASKDEVILNFSASSGDFLKHLASPVRVNIASTSPTETAEPIFAEFFLRGLESKRAAMGKGGPANMLDAYNWATQQTAMWISRWTQTPFPDPKHPVGPTIWKASGKETIDIYQKLYGNDSSRKLDPSSNGNAADAPSEMGPPNGVVTDAWEGRRVVDEHATLEDCGESIGVAALSEKGFQPIIGKSEKDPGFLSAHTVLGQPILPAPAATPAASGTVTVAAAPTPVSPSATPAVSTGTNITAPK